MKHANGDSELVADRIALCMASSMSLASYSGLAWQAPVQRYFVQSKVAPNNSSSGKAVKYVPPWEVLQLRGLE